MRMPTGEINHVESFGFEEELSLIRCLGREAL